MAGAGAALRVRDGLPWRRRVLGGSTPDGGGIDASTTMSGQVMTFARRPVWVVLAAAP